MSCSNALIIETSMMGKFNAIKNLQLRRRDIVINTTYRLELGLVLDDEAISVIWPLDDGTIIVAFSIQHDSELLVRMVALTTK